MSVQVTLRVFSGRRNPSWALNEDEIRQLHGWLERARPGLDDAGATLLCKLCYDGFQLDVRDEPGLPSTLRIRSGGIAPERREDAAVIAATEHFLLSTGENREIVPPQVAIEVNRWIEYFRDHQCPPAPPAKKSDYAKEPLQSETNCYNYAADTESQDHNPATPGASVNKPVNEAGMCEAVLKAALLDKLTVKPSGAKGEIRVALVVRPGLDFHWYRRHANGFWSHKYSFDPPRDYDEEGKLISDPQSCARACYTTFCGFYYADPKKVRLHS